MYGILTPMARTSSRSRKEIPAPVQPSFFESLSPHTKQAIGSVSLIVFGVLFVLAYYGLAGRVGDYTHTGLSWLFGYGYALAPLLCFSYAILLLRPELDDHVSTPKIIGIALLYSSILGFLTLLMPSDSFMLNGGALGYIIAQPLNYLLGDLAASIILGALLLVGIFLTFNTGFVRPAFLKKKAEEEYEDEVFASMPDVEDISAKSKKLVASEISEEEQEDEEEAPTQRKLSERIMEKVTPAPKSDELVMTKQTPTSSSAPLKTSTSPSSSTKCLSVHLLHATLLSQPKAFAFQKSSVFALISNSPLRHRRFVSKHQSPASLSWVSKSPTRRNQPLVSHHSLPRPSTPTTPSHSWSRSVATLPAKHTL